MPSFVRPCLCAAALLWQVCALAALIDPAQARRELEKAEALAESSPAAGLDHLKSLEQRLGADAPYALRRDMLRAQVWMLEDAGELARSFEVEREALRLALAHQDGNYATLARLSRVRQLLSENKAADAEAALAEVRRQMPPKPERQALGAVASVEGDVHNAQSRFDKALASYLQALQLEQDNPRGGDRRANLLVAIAQVYTNSDNPGKAVEMAQQGLRESAASSTTVGRLQATLGTALMQLGRDREGITALRAALDTAVKSKMPLLEASVRGNIADYYLRQHDFIRAEQEARMALAASNRVNEQNMIVMARANLGFALMGQGRMDEGTPYIDSLVAQLRTAGATADLNALLDEKGRMQERAGMYQKALATVREQQAVQLSEARAARDQAVAALQEQYAAAQRTREIEALRRENQLKDADLHNRRLVQLLTTFAAVLTVLAGAVVLMLYRRAARSNAKLQLLNTQLEFHSMRDALTGLHNRRSFLQKMAQRAQRAESERRDDAPGRVDCLALMDIDHFKHINDRWGHGVGDLVLVEVARRLTAAVRDSDMVLRWGGEEFMIYAPGTDPAHISEVPARVLQEIGGTPVDAGSCSVPVTLSAGVISLPFAGVPDTGFDWERGVRIADWALYQGKANGRNQARIVTRLAMPVDQLLATIDSAKDTAPDALASMEVVRGPQQSR